MPEELPVADKHAILTYLRHITEGWQDLGEAAAIELRCLMPDRSPHIARFAPDEDGFGMLAEQAIGMNETGLNCYMVVNPVRASAPLRRDGKLSGAMDDDIIGAFFFWADGDDENAALSIKNFAGPKWTMAVTTGRVPTPRPHIYWRIEDGPVRNLPAWTEIQKAIANRLSTDRSVVNPSRIMRLPGTINWPTDKKAAKGRVPELATLRTDYDDERSPVTFEQMRRAFGWAADAPPSPGSGIAIDTGAKPLDRERARIQALSGQEWHNAVVPLVGSYVSKGLSDDEIHSLTEPLTLAGYTVEQTRRDVQVMIDGARRKGWTPESDHRPNFDHDPAPTISDPEPAKTTWRVQSAADFVADFVAPEYLVDGVIQRGRLYTFTAPTGSGKTAAMLYAATAISSGMQFCGVEVEQGDVLFLAGENPDDVRARMIATMDFYGIKPSECRMHFIAGTFSIRADLERLKAEAARLPNLVLIVVDTFAAYFDGDDENSNAQALDFARVVRRLTAIPSKPAVIMPAHPVKNATRQNLAPKGGSSLVNEVDGNLTLWNSDGLLTLHWQVKHRGPDFEPMNMELVRMESEHIRDRKGRAMPTILAKPVLEMRAIQMAKERLTIEDRLLLNIADDPSLSLRERGRALGVTRKGGEVDTGRMSRIIDKLAGQKLIRKFRTKWELTKDGERAVEEIQAGLKLPAEVAG